MARKHNDVPHMGDHGSFRPGIVHVSCPRWRIVGESDNLKFGLAL